MEKIKNIKITNKKPNKLASQHLIDLRPPVKKQQNKINRLPRIRIKYWIKQLNIGRQIINWKKIRKIILLVMFFSILIILIIYFLHGQVKKTNQQITSSAQQIIQLGEEMLINVSQFNFEQLSENLEQINQSLSQMQQQLAVSKEYKIVKYSPYGWGIKHFLIGSQSLVQAGQNAERLVDVLLIPVEFPQLTGFLSDPLPVDEDKDEIKLPSKLEQINFLASSYRFNQQLQELTLNIKQARQEFNKINGLLFFTKYRQSWCQWQKILDNFQDSLQRWYELSKHLESIFGSQDLRRYLVVFQNNQEIRATGGFIGSFARIDWQQGKIKHFVMPADGSYNLQGSLALNLRAPQPLHLVQPRWQFHDANWFPDWPTSAQKLAWFYEKSGGVSLDGVIAVNANLIQNLFAVWGPIQLSNHRSMINENNFITEVEKNVEIEKTKQRPPKQILVDLTSRILEHLIDFQNNGERDKILEILQIVNQGIIQKDVMFYSRNPEIQHWLEAENWAGQLTSAKQDYLSVIVTNVNGAKVEGVIKQTMKHRAVIQDNGSIINQLIIKREHQGNLKDNFTGKETMDWIRIYVPRGSQLLDIQGFSIPPENDFLLGEIELTNDVDLIKQEKLIKNDLKSNTRITEQFNKTCFANWLILKPGEEKEIILTYQLPWKFDERTYSLLTQKQSGQQPIFFQNSLVLPTIPDKIIWQYPENKLEIKGRNINQSVILDQDRFWGIMVK